MLSALRPFGLFLGGAVLVLVLGFLTGSADFEFVGVLSLLILLAGLPHGAFDYYLLAAHYQGAQLAGALAGYLALIGITALIWWLLPLVFLFSFLAYSAFHFGDSDWPGRTPMHKWAWGLAVVALPCLLAPARVASLFSVITGVAELAQLTSLFGLLAIPAVIYCCWPRDTVSPNPMPVLLGSYALIGLAAGPLAAFACYFACLHSPFHLRRWRQRTAHGSLLAVYALTAVVLACVGGLIWLYPVAWQHASAATIDPSAVRYTFVALAALTVPHMTLLFALQRMDSAQA